MAAVGAHRTGRMGDIVATIQAEQDRVIRSDLTRRAGRAGRAGHRQDRRRAAPGGVPALHPPRPPGPQRRAAGRAQPALPALHRAGAARRSARPASCMSTAGELYPGVSGVDEPRPGGRPGQGRPADGAGAVPRGARPAAAAGRAAQAAGRRDGHRADGRRGGRGPGAGAAYPQAAQRGPRGLPPRPAGPPGARAGDGARAPTSTPTAARTCSPTCATARTSAASSTSPGCRCRRPRCWPTSTPTRRRLGRGGAELTPDRARAAGPRPGRRRGRSRTCRCSTSSPSCSARSRPATARPRPPPAPSAPRTWSARAGRALSNLDTAIRPSAEQLAERFADTGPRLTVAERAETDRTWAFGHLVVDEAQELSPMMWRLLMRRCPSRSMTLVGDVAQVGLGGRRLVLGGGPRPLRGRAAGDRGADGQLPHPRAGDADRVARSWRPPASRHRRRSRCATATARRPRGGCAPGGLAGALRDAVRAELGRPRRRPAGRRHADRPRRRRCGRR